MRILEITVWCSFCSSEESAGEVTGMFPFTEDGSLKEMTLPIGKECLSRIKDFNVLD